MTPSQIYDEIVRLSVRDLAELRAMLRRLDDEGGGAGVREPTAPRSPGPSVGDAIAVYHYAGEDA